MQQETRENELRQQLPLELAGRLAGQSPQFGKTAFLKMAYLLQELYDVPLGYRFSLYTYGPYSPEVLADLEYANLRKQVEVEYLGDPQGGFRITPSRVVGGSNSQNELMAKYSQVLDDLVEHFGSFNARELELRTTSQSIYAAVSLPGMLWGKALRSPFPHPHIVSIDTTTLAVEMRLQQS